jgi:hypothetical protein
MPALQTCRTARRENIMLARRRYTSSLILALQDLFESLGRRLHWLTIVGSIRKGLASCASLSLPCSPVDQRLLCDVLSRFLCALTVCCHVYVAHSNIAVTAHTQVGSQAPWVSGSIPAH